MSEPITDDYLISYAIGQQKDKSPFNYEPCTSCTHEFHGLPCTKRVAGFGGTVPCDCPR